MVKPHWLLRFAYPGVVWNISTEEKILYLTFDDGPIPQVTPKVLEILKQYNAKATFFCIGDNVKKHPDVYAQLLEDGHKTGNHTFHHFNNWKTGSDVFLKDVEEASKIIASGLFRPPYGKLFPKALSKLKKNYRVIMWDVISNDFDIYVPKEKVLENVITNAKAGSIIVFHDSIKAQESMLYALPRVLEYFSERGFRFELIPASN